MKVYHDINALPAFANAVITIGSFDGVHLGHRKLIQKIKDLAEEVDGEDVLITFHPHPRSIIYPNDHELRLLTTLEEKLNLLEEAGVSNVVIVPFSVEFSQQSPHEYIQEFLLKSFDPRYIVIGYDHRFGLNRSGDIHLLQEYADKENFEIVEIKKQELEDIAISSTKIRNALGSGDIQQATSYMQSKYTLRGAVVSGDQIGTTLGFPTANIKLDDNQKLIPADGVYACTVHTEGVVRGGMLYIGDRPTVDGTHAKVIEVNIFDFKGSIYGKQISIEFESFIRGEQRFANLDELQAQLHQDQIAAQAYLAKSQEHQQDAAKCTIAILNYNGLDHLETYLHTVQNNLPDSCQLRVIDNGSTDESVQYIEEWFPEVELHQLQENHGFAEGYNRGMEKITSEYTVLLNSDIKTTDDWISPILDYMDKHPEVGAVQPKILSLEQPDHFEYAGACGGYMDRLIYPFCRGRIFDQVEKDEGQYETVEDVFWVSGCAMVIRTELYRDLGGLDKDYFAHMEEIDLCWRIHRAGYRCVVMPSTKVYHLGGGTLGYDNPRKTYLNFRNNLNTLLKNNSFARGMSIFLPRLVLDGIAGVKMLVDGNYKSTLAIIKAHFSVYGGLAHTYRKKALYDRLIEAAKIGPEDKGGWYRSSILTSYYLKGKKTFDKLDRNKIQ